MILANRIACAPRSQIILSIKNLYSGSLMNYVREISRAGLVQSESWICSRCITNHTTRRKRTYKTSDHTQQSLSTRNLETPQLPGDEIYLPRAPSLQDVNRKGQSLSRNPESVEEQPQSAPSFPPFKAYLLARRNQRTETQPRQTRDPYGILDALKEGELQSLVCALADARQDPWLLRGIPDTTWHEILRSFDPSKWILQRFRTLPNLMNKNLRKATHRSASVAHRLVRSLSRVVGIRKELGKVPDLATYRILLAWAVKVGNARISKAIWNDMMEDGVHPDLECFNARMEAIVSEADATVKNKSVRERSRSESNPVVGASKEVQLLHQSMLQDYDIAPDETSYCALLTALCCEGDAGGGLDLLSSVWKLDIVSVVTGLQNAVEVESRAFPHGHPLRPTKKLLSTIADNLGYSNRTLDALRLVTFLSKQYHIPIDSHIKLSLLHWTYYHARIEGGEWKKEYHGIPDAYWKLPALFESFQEVGSHSIDEQMVHLLLRNARRLHRTGKEELLQFLSIGDALLARQKDSTRQRTLALQMFRKQLSGTISKSRSEAHHHRQFLKQTISNEITRAYMRQWLKEILRGGPPDSIPLSPERAAEIADWRLRDIPVIISRYRRLCPTEIRYWVPGGEVIIVNSEADSWDEPSPAYAQRAPRQLRPEVVWKKTAGRHKTFMEDPRELVSARGELRVPVKL